MALTTDDTCDWSLPGKRERKLSVMVPPSLLKSSSTRGFTSHCWKLVSSLFIVKAYFPGQAREG